MIKTKENQMKRERRDIVGREISSKKYPEEKKIKKISIGQMPIRRKKHRIERNKTKRRNIMNR